MSACWKVVLPQALQHALLQCQVTLVMGQGSWFQCFICSSLASNVGKLYRNGTLSCGENLAVSKFCLSTNKTHLLSYFHTPAPKQKTVFHKLTLLK